MDAFEQLVAEILYAEGYWVQTSVKVVLTKEEKRQVGRHSTPRWELDVVGYRAAQNEILVIECKSFLDSTGVQVAELQDGHTSKRYKLFREPVLRETVLNRLTLQMIEAGRCTPGVTVRLGMVAGRIKRGNEDQLREHFKSKGWELYGPEWLRAKLHELANDGYSNQVSSVVAKLLLRGAAMETSETDGNESNGVPSRRTIPLNTPIELMVDENPKKPDSMAFKRFEGYFHSDATTIEGALGCGVRRDDIRNDLGKGYIRIRGAVEEENHG